MEGLFLAFWGHPLLWYPLLCFECRTREFNRIGLDQGALPVVWRRWCFFWDVFKLVDEVFSHNFFRLIKISQVNKLVRRSSQVFHHFCSKNGRLRRFLIEVLFFGLIGFFDIDKRLFNLGFSCLIENFWFINENIWFFVFFEVFLKHGLFFQKLILDGVINASKNIGFLMMREVFLFGLDSWVVFVRKVAFFKEGFGVVFERIIGWFFSESSRSSADVTFGREFGW